MGTRPTSICAATLLSMTACAAERPPAAVTVAPAEAATAAPRATEAPPKARGGDVFKPAPDVVVDDASLAAGTVRVTALDADGEPIARAPVTFEEVIVRDHAAGLEVVAEDSAIADDKGVATFRKARVAPEHRYMASVRRGDGTFATEPFVLDPRSGKRVVLHAYETVRALDRAAVAMQTMVVLMVRADAIDVEVLHVIHDLGRTAWVPAGVRVAFPPRAFDFHVSDLGMPVRADAITEAGFTIVGTVAPGKTELTYRYRIPRDRSGTQRIVLDQPPRNFQARVILEAGGAARLTVAGFPAAQTQDVQGVPVLVTDRRAEKGEPGIETLDITLTGDPR